MELAGYNLSFGADTISRVLDDTNVWSFCKVTMLSKSF